MELEGEAVVVEEEDTEDEEEAEETHKTQQTIKVKKRRRGTDQRLFVSDVIRMATLHLYVLRDSKRYKKQTKWRQKKLIHLFTCTRLYS